MIKFQKLIKSFSIIIIGISIPVSYVSLKNDTYKKTNVKVR